MPSRLPRSPGLSPWRPRTPKVPGPPTVEALLKKDDAEGIAKRFEHVEWASTSAADRDEFWAFTWPKLLRRCQKVNAPACYCTLVAMFSTTRDILLPSDTLAGLLEAEEKFVRFADRWNTGDGQQFARRLAASPQTLRSSDWLRLVRLGGLNSITNPAVADTIEQTNWYVQGWRSWCDSQKNRDDALDLMVAEGARASRYEFAGVFKRMLEAMPGAQREGFGEGLSQRLAPKVPRLLEGLKKEAREAQGFNGWATTARRYDVGRQHATWTAWFQGLSEVIARSQDIEAVKQAYDLLRTVFQTDRKDLRAPDGLVWTGAQAQGWARYLSQVLLDAPAKVRVGIHPKHNEALTALFNLDHILSVWGLANAQADQAFSQTMDTELPAWRAVIEVQALGEEHIPDLRQQWRSRVLERHLAKAWHEDSQPSQRPRF